MARTCADVVVSYTVRISGVESGDSSEYARLAQLLEEGYRVVDVLSTPAGGGTSGAGHVVVTVILTDPEKINSGFAYGETA